MQFFKNTIGLIAVLSVIPTAYAATSRATTATATGSRVGVSAAGTTSRVPTLSTVGSKSSSSTSTSSGSTTSSALLANADCINAYTDCIKGADTCGENFEECTNKILFHGKMPNCLSTLAQCSSAGVESLFGTSTISALSDVSSTNSYGEVTGYKYPTDGSVLGQMITAAAISNRYDTSTCVRRYTSCLKKETVCGADFELCTTDKEFRKQRVFCDSTLARCSGDGVKELFGSSSLTATPAKSSRIGEMIEEGAALAAVNAVSTCYKSVDRCIENACAESPYRCSESSSTLVAELADAIQSGREISDVEIEEIISKNGEVNKASIAAFIKNSCFDTIGTSKYCYATFIGNGQMPTNAQLRDEENQAEVYEEAYAARMNASMRAKIADMVNKFDTRAKQKCTDVVKSCAMRVCGGGVGSACYAAVYGSGGVKSINANNANGYGPYNDIKSGCEVIVNTDTNCKYAAANPNSVGTYTYSYINNRAFDTVFPEYDDGAEKDVIGVVAALNSTLATSYNDAAIANMKKQCQNVATSCVKSMCGADYVNCYRSRTDVYSDLTKTNNESFNMSMNKVGGVLDYTIVLGLCLDTVKNSAACEEHLAIEMNDIKNDGSWGDNNTLRGGWIDAGSASNIESRTSSVQMTDAYGNKLCRTTSGEECVCDTISEMNGEVCDIAEMVDYTTYVQTQAASSLFKDLIYDIEKEAQAKYNAKLNREQQMCLSSNNGGVIGNKDMGSTFMWVKLKGNKIPKDYSVNGLKSTAFAASNDLYGSFCRVRVTLHSDDKKIQEAMKDKSWATAYFATGDSFTCGSWIPDKELQKIGERVAEGDDYANSKDAASRERLARWTGVLGGIAGGLGGVALGEGIRNGNILPGLVNSGKNSSYAEQCVDTVTKFNGTQNLGTQKDLAIQAVLYANKAGVDSLYTKAVSDAAQASGQAAQGLDFDGYMQVATGGKSSGAPKQSNNMQDGLKTAMADLGKACQGKMSNTSTNTGNERPYWGITAGTAAVSTLIGGWTVWKATKDIQNSELDAEQKAAYEEWMKNVGRHITCYIGGDEAGSYGDVISTSLE